MSYRDDLEAFTRVRPVPAWWEIWTCKCPGHVWHDIDEPGSTCLTCDHAIERTPVVEATGGMAA